MRKPAEMGFERKRGTRKYTVAPIPEIQPPPPPPPPLPLLVFLPPLPPQPSLFEIIPTIIFGPMFISMLFRFMTIAIFLVQTPPLVDQPCIDNDIFTDIFREYADVSSGCALLFNVTAIDNPLWHIFEPTHAQYRLVMGCIDFLCSVQKEDFAEDVWYAYAVMVRPFWVMCWMVIVQVIISWGRLMLAVYHCIAS